MPTDERKIPRTIYLKPALWEWLVSFGDGNAASGIEKAARKAGYKEGGKKAKKENDPRKRLHLDNEPLTCSDAIIST